MAAVYRGQLGSGKKPFCLGVRWIGWIVVSGCSVMGCGNVRGELWFLGMSSGGGVVVGPGVQAVGGFVGVGSA